MIQFAKDLLPVFIKDFAKSLIKKPKAANSIPENWHVDFVRDLSLIMQIQVYAELGIYEGETFNSIVAPTKIAVDIDPKYLSYADRSPNSKKILGDSTVLATFLSDNSIRLDMLFIDANHSREAVYSDFSNLEAFMNPHGIVLMHDTFPKSKSYSAQQYCGDAYLALDKLTQDFKNWSFATIPVHPGLTLATRLPNRPNWSM